MLTEEGAGNGAPAPPNARAAGQASPAGLLRKGPLRVLLQEEGGGSACSAPRRASGPRTHMPASRGEKPSGGEGRTPARSDHSVPTRLGEQKSRCAQLQGCLEEGRSPGRVCGGGACGTSRGSLCSDSRKQSPHPHGARPTASFLISEVQLRALWACRASGCVGEAGRRVGESCPAEGSIPMPQARSRSASWLSPSHQAPAGGQRVAGAHLHQLPRGQGQALTPN